VGYVIRAVPRLDVGPNSRPTLVEALRCQGCTATVDWRRAKDPRTGRFVCPNCGGKRSWAHSATPALREAIGEREAWTCHRCHLPVDRSVCAPHPLAGVADHHPITRAHGGPTIAANLKIAHMMCNGGPPLVNYPFTDEQHVLLLAIHDRWDEVTASRERQQHELDDQNEQGPRATIPDRP
jgi:hypothetical protein